jgi:CRP/FNR family transcriptional regulator, cyclic AMP receptor protein
MVDGRPAAEIAGLLKKCPLFSRLDDRDCAALASYAARRRFRAGDVIFRAGDPGESLMGILVGTVRIGRPAPDGGEITIADFSAGDVLGEIAVLDGRERSADATAVTNCELVVIERRDLMPFLRQRPELCIGLLLLLCDKLRSADERAIDFVFLDLGARLAKALLARSSVVGGGPTRRLALKQGELAKMIGAARSNVNRQLRQWERLGIVESRLGWLYVLEPSKLAAMATHQ